jgi:hypothetical protein
VELWIVVGVVVTALLVVAALVDRATWVSGGV